MATDPKTENASRSETLELAKTIAIALLIALVLRVVLFQPFTIPSASMEPGLVEGDYVIVSKFSYGWSRYSIPLGLPLFKGRIFGHDPARGDVAVFQLPRDPKVSYIKRIIGLPGDRVRVLDGVVYVNGKAIPRTPIGMASDPSVGGMPVTEYRETRADGRAYVTYQQPGEHEGDTTGVYVVPAGQYFAMGDNRDNSSDSRWPRETGVGFVPAENLIGEAQFVLLSWSPGASIFKPWTWVLNLRPSRFFHGLR